MCDCTEEDKVRMAQYMLHAIPRLAAIDALSDACRWDEMAPSYEAMQARERWTRLMVEQGQAEVEAGL